MFRSSVTWLTLLLTAQSALAQTFTSCDPTKKTCPDNPALSSRTYTHDFTTSGFDSDAWNVTAGSVKATSSGLEFTVTKSGDAPTIRSKWYIFFGRVSFLVRAAPGNGIVSSAILQSDDLDEIDWEWLGGTGYADKSQSNYFSKGNASSYDRAVWSDTPDTQTRTQNYTISWTVDATTWYVDGVPLRTLSFADAQAATGYPQTPMDVRIGIWAGGDPANDEGTIEWAGGETDYAAGPYTMVLERVEVVNENPGESYTYGDLTGGYESIVVNGALDGDTGSKSGSDKARESPSASRTASKAEGTATTVVVPTSQSGVVGIASLSASAALAETTSSRASSVTREVWQGGMLGMLLLVVVCW